jgi:hypothetical protein
MVAWKFPVISGWRTFLSLKDDPFDLSQPGSPFNRLQILLDLLVFIRIPGNLESLFGGPPELLQARELGWGDKIVLGEVEHPVAPILDEVRKFLDQGGVPVKKPALRLFMGYLT